MVVVRRRKLKSSLVWLAALPWLVGAAAIDRDLEGIRKKIDSEKKELSELKAKEGSVR